MNTPESGKQSAQARQPVDLDTLWELMCKAAENRAARATERTAQESAPRPLRKPKRRSPPV